MREVEARAAKAQKLADVLWRAQITEEAARRMTAVDWSIAAVAAHCHPPNSEATRQAVYALLATHYGWQTITDVPCFFRHCSGTIRWAENGYVPGYRICDKCGRHYQFCLSSAREHITKRSIRPNGRRSPLLPDGRVSFFVPWSDR